jgi:hypothetical protein
MKPMISVGSGFSPVKNLAVRMASAALLNNSKASPSSRIQD